MKPDCYKCKYRRNLVGDCHSSCAHPPFDKLVNDPLLALLGIMSSASKQPLPTYNTLDMKLQINPHGKAHGWANHPWNFDPIWIDSCDGFEGEEPK